jgi:hypothetical protein
VQCDLWEPRDPVPVGHGQTRRGWVVTAEPCSSRVIAGALIFSKEAPDILWGLGRCLSRIGALPEKLVWDREGAIAPAGHPTEAFAGFCGQLGVGWMILDAGDAQAKGVLERSHRFMRTNFESGRRFANPLDFRDQLDGWCDRGDRRVHRTVRVVPAEQLAEEQGRTRPLPETLPDCDRRLVVRVAQSPPQRSPPQRGSVFDRHRRINVLHAAGWSTFQPAQVGHFSTGLDTARLERLHDYWRAVGEGWWPSVPRGLRAGSCHSWAPTADRPRAGAWPDAARMPTRPTTYRGRLDRARHDRHPAVGRMRGPRPGEPCAAGGPNADRVSRAAAVTDVSLPASKIGLPSACSRTEASASPRSVGMSA